MDEKAKKLALAKAKAKALQMQADADSQPAPAMQADPQMPSGATGGPAGGLVERSEELTPANPSSFANTARSFLAGATADLNTGIANAIGDKEAAVGAQSDPVARAIGMAVSPLNKIGGGSLGGQVLNNVGQAVFSGAMRNQDAENTAEDAAFSAMMPVVFNRFAKWLAKGDAKVPRAVMSQEHIDSLPNQISREEAIARIPQADANAAYIEQQKMRNVDPDIASKTMSQDPNYVRQNVEEFNRGRESTFDVSPVAQNERAISNVDAAEANRIAAYDPVAGRNLDLNKTIESLENDAAELARTGRMNRATEIKRLIEEFKAARASQDMGKFGAAVRGQSNPLTQSVESVPVPGGGISGPKTQSIPEVAPVTASAARQAMSASNYTIPGNRITEGITEELRAGRAQAGGAKPSVEKGAVEPAFIESSDALARIAAQNMSGAEYIELQNAIQRAKAAEEAAKSSTANLMGGISEPSLRGGAKTTVASSLANPILSRWRMYRQNRIVDNAINKLRTANDPGLQDLAKWIESASGEAGVAARSFIAAKQNPEFLKMIQEGDKENE